MELLHIIDDLPNQVKEGVRLASGIKLENPSSLNNIVICGMGGSGFPGDVVKSLLFDSKISITTIKGYKLPGFVNSSTLVLVNSYSGDTEETISAYRDALKRNAKIVVLTSGGKLKIFVDQDNQKHKIPLILIPKGLPPRNAIGYFVFAILGLLHNNSIIKLDASEVSQTIDALQNKALKDKAKEIVEQIENKLPVIYTSQRLEGVALIWKQAFNENANIFSFYNVFPELNHEEIMAFKNPRQDLFFIFIRAEKDNPQINKRIDLTKELLKKTGMKSIELRLTDISLMVKTFVAIYIGDLVSYYLAKKYDVDPLNTDLIKDFKKRL